MGPEVGGGAPTPQRIGLPLAVGKAEVRDEEGEEAAKLRSGDIDQKVAGSEPANSAS